MPKKTTSISGKLTWMNIAVSSTALLLACTAFVFYDLASFRQITVRNLLVQAQIAGENTKAALLFNDPQAAEETISAAKLAPEITAGGIYTGDGKPFASFRREGALPIPANLSISGLATDSQIFENSWIIVVHPILSDGKLIGYVYLRASTRGIQQRISRYVTIAAMVMLASLLAAMLVSLIFKRSVAVPIVELAKVARSLSQDKDYSIRAQPLKNRGEITLMIDAFNDMLAEIQRQDVELQEAHDKLEERVADRTAQLEVSNKELEAFSYSVSHDLRAPLRGIDGFSRALMEDYGDKLDDTGKDYLRRVLAGVQRMAGLIDDMLNLARVARSEMRFETVDLSSIARSVAEEFRKQTARDNVEFVIADGIVVQGDPRLLRIVLDNLLGNAWKYTSNHPAARIEFGTLQQQDRRVYFVRDDGAGFDPRYGDRLFGAFQRLHTAKEFPGSGVGLATVQRIIRRHRGEVWAESAVEQGATFYFTLEINLFSGESNERVDHLVGGR